MLEEGSDEYFEEHGYTRETRGAAYIQVTGSAHNDYLEYKGIRLSKVKKSANAIYDTASYIAKNYPWDSACWEWAKQKKGEGVILDKYVKENGNSLGVYLVCQYFINSFPTNGDDDLGSVRRGKKFKYDEKDDIIKIGRNKYKAPSHWEKREELENRINETIYNAATDWMDYKFVKMNIEQVETEITGHNNKYISIFLSYYLKTI